MVVKVLICKIKRLIYNECPYVSIAWDEDIRTHKNKNTIAKIFKTQNTHIDNMSVSLCVCFNVSLIHLFLYMLSLSRVKEKQKSQFLASFFFKWTQKNLSFWVQKKWRTGRTGQRGPCVLIHYPLHLPGSWWPLHAPERTGSIKARSCSRGDVSFVMPWQLEPSPRPCSSARSNASVSQLYSECWFLYPKSLNRLHSLTIAYSVINYFRQDHLVIIVLYITNPSMCSPMY